MARKLTSIEKRMMAEDAKIAKKQMEKAFKKLGKKKRKTRVVADKWKPDFFDLVEVVKTVMEGREYRSQYPYTNPDFAVTHACKIIAGRSEDSKKRVMEFIDKGWGNRENFVAKVFAHIEKEIAEAKPVRKNAKQD